MQKPLLVAVVVLAIVCFIEGNGVPYVGPPLCNVDSFFTCISDGGCMVKFYRCDGEEDCDDGSDEKCCPPPVKGCPAGKFLCANGNCLYPVSVCDGDNNCGDNSDETNCATKICPAASGPWKRCSDNRCLPMSRVCDGGSYCVDGQDEAGCHVNGHGCKRNQFTCDVGVCEDMNYVCDGYNDCNDLSDEGNCFACAHNPCKNCGSCYNGRVSGYICVCRPGYTGKDCGELVCKNGGIFSANKCICPLWTRGKFCQGTFKKPCGYYWSRHMRCFKKRMYWRIHNKSRNASMLRH